MSSDEGKEVFYDSFHHSIHWFSLLIIAIGTVISYFIARGITVPLCKLTQSAKCVAQGDFSAKVDINGSDEVGVLSRSFNEMAHSLQASEKRQKRLLADIAHELKTPLTILRGNLEGMIDGVVARNDCSLQTLLEEAIQLNHLVNDLRDLTLADAGDLVLDIASTNIAQVLEHAVQSFKQMADERDIKISCTADDNMKLNVDRRRMAQVLGNLIANAIRHTHAGGMISVSCKQTIVQSRSIARIIVADTGEGIEEADLPYIFECCFRGDRSRAKDTGGSGIGLAIVKRLVEMHGGKITVSSRSGAGTTFTIDIPQ